MKLRTFLFALTIVMTLSLTASAQSMKDKSKIEGQITVSDGNKSSLIL